MPRFLSFIFTARSFPSQMTMARAAVLGRGEIITSATFEAYPYPDNLFSSIDLYSFTLGIFPLCRVMKRERLGIAFLAT